VNRTCQIKGIENNINKSIKVLIPSKKNITSSKLSCAYTLTANSGMRRLMCTRCLLMIVLILGLLSIMFNEGSKMLFCCELGSCGIGSAASGMFTLMKAYIQFPPVALGLVVDLATTNPKYPSRRNRRILDLRLCLVTQIR